MPHSFHNDERGCAGPLPGAHVIGAGRGLRAKAGTAADWFKHRQASVYPQARHNQFFPDSRHGRRSFETFDAIAGYAQGAPRSLSCQVCITGPIPLEHLAPAERLCENMATMHCRPKPLDQISMARCRRYAIRSQSSPRFSGNGRTGDKRLPFIHGPGGDCPPSAIPGAAASNAAFRIERMISKLKAVSDTEARRGKRPAAVARCMAASSMTFVIRMLLHVKRR